MYEIAEHTVNHGPATVFGGDGNQDKRSTPRTFTVQQNTAPCEFMKALPQETPTHERVPHRPDNLSALRV